MVPMLRILLFLGTNIAVMAIFSVVMFVLSSTGILPPSVQSNEYVPLLIFSGIFGMGGAFMSLLLSKTIAKWTTGAKIIETPRTQEEIWLVQTVHDQAARAGIGKPEVAIFPSPDPNAFATGASKNNALVAVSTGLLQIMRREEVEAVLGHEVSHIANGDMVTLTLIQGVLNTFVIFLSRVLGSVIDKAIFKNERGRGMGYYLVVMVLQIVLGILASIIVAWFSRRREYRADAGGAKLTDPEAMASALARLKAVHEPGALPENMATFGIRGGGGFMALFQSHPPL
ncbi:MAG: protease HtpX, partial [Myxococcales bacterium]|nr:protease HtpX [Myxococcales bacterium]